MTVVLLIDAIVVISLVVSGRRRLEEALPLLCFFLVLMPLESRLVIPGLFDLGTDRVAILTLLVLYFVRGERRSSRPIPLKRLMYLQIVWAICSTLYSISVPTSVKQLIGQVIEYYVLYYILLKIITDTQTVYKILYSMMIAMGLCSLFALFEPYASWSILMIFPSNLWNTYGRMDPLYIEWGRGLRVRSTFPHPILFGDALAMSIPITLYLLSIGKQYWQRCLLWAALLLMFWAIYKTSSRGPWIALGASSVLLFFLVRNRVKKYLTVIALLVGIVLVSRPGIWQTIANLYESTQDAGSPEGASYEYRPALNHAIRVAVGKDVGRAILGYGLGTFREKGLDIDFLGEVKRWYTCDNNWAVFLYETGYGGLLIVGALLFQPLLITLRSYRRLPRPAKYLSGVLFISLAGFYFMLLSVAGYSWGQQGFMAWIFISLAVAYPRIVMREQRANSIAEEPLDIAIATPAAQIPAVQFQ